jgi:hypothetical protein
MIGDHDAREPQPNDSAMSERSGQRMSWLGLMGSFLGLTIVGTPMLAYVWESLNRLLSGVFEPMRLALTALIAVALWLYLRWVAGLVERWQTTANGGGAS